MKNIIIIFSFCIFLVVENSVAQLEGSEVFNKVNKSVLLIYGIDFNGKTISQGSGVVVDENGLIITNYHNFEECEKLFVKGESNSTNYFEIIAADINKDLLIFKTELKFPEIDFGKSKDINIGQNVYAIGNPEGLKNTMTKGIISGFRKFSNFKDWIQFDASINHGSSGGALVNEDGELIGITAAGYILGAGNFNFAIPVSDVNNLILNIPNTKIEKEALTYICLGYNAFVNEKKSVCKKYTDKYLSLIPNDAFACYLRGKCSLTEEAKSYFNKAISLNNNFADAYYELGRIEASETNPDCIKAIQYLNKAIEIDPNNPDSYLWLSKCYRKNKLYEEALKNINISIELKSGTHDVWSYYYNKAHIFMDKNDYPFALEILKIALDENIEFIRDMEKLERENKIRYIQMIKNSISKLIQGDIYQDLGDCNYNLKYYEEAIKNWEQAIILEPKQRDKLKSKIEEAKNKLK